MSIQDLVEWLPLHRRANSIVKPAVSNRIAGYSHNFREEVVLRYSYIRVAVVVGRIGEGNTVVADAADNLVENSLLAAAGNIVAGNNIHLGVAGMGMSVAVAVAVGIAADNLVANSFLAAAGSAAAGNSTHLGVAGMGMDVVVGGMDQPDVYRHSHSHILHSADLPVCHDENEHLNPIHYHVMLGLRECDRDQKRPVSDSREVHQSEYPTGDKIE